jgi:hypothetical protein
LYQEKITDTYTSSKGELSWLGIQLKVRSNLATESKGNPRKVGQNLIQVIMLHNPLMKDRDNPPVEQNHIQDMVLRRTPTVLPHRILMVLLLLRTLTPHLLRNNTVLHLISRAATGMDMHPHSKHLVQ